MVELVLAVEAADFILGIGFFVSATSVSASVGIYGARLLVLGYQREYNCVFCTSVEYTTTHTTIFV